MLSDKRLLHLRSQRVIIDSSETSREISRSNIDETSLICGRYLVGSESETKFKLNAAACGVLG